MKKAYPVIALLIAVFMICSMVVPALAADEGDICSLRGHNYERANQVNASCTNGGYYTMSCTRCGESYTESDGTGALGHNWSNWKTVSDATCTSGGKKTRECYRCGKGESSKTGALGHAAEDMTVIVEAGPFNKGEREGVCSRCGESVREEFYPEGTVFRGDRSDDVTALQEVLNAAGFDCGKADGVFGKNTERAVREAEASLGVEEDGIGWPGLLDLAADEIMPMGGVIGWDIEANTSDGVSIAKFAVWRSEGVVKNDTVVYASNGKKAGTIKAGTAIIVGNDPESVKTDGKFHSIAVESETNPGVYKSYMIAEKDIEYDPGVYENTVIEYEVIIQIDADMTIDNIEIMDPLAPGGYLCQGEYLNGDASYSGYEVSMANQKVFEYTYTVTAEDAACGYVENTAQMTWYNVKNDADGAVASDTVHIDVIGGVHTSGAVTAPVEEDENETVSCERVPVGAGVYELRFCPEHRLAQEFTAQYMADDPNEKTIAVIRSMWALALDGLYGEWEAAADAEEIALIEADREAFDAQLETIAALTGSSEAEIAMLEARCCELCFALHGNALPAAVEETAEAEENCGFTVAEGEGIVTVTETVCGSVAETEAAVAEVLAKGGDALWDEIAGLRAAELNEIYAGITDFAEAAEADCLAFEAMRTAHESAMELIYPDAARLIAEDILFREILLYGMIGE